MDFYSIKQAVMNLSNTEFFRFFSWYEKFGWEQIDKFTKSSKLRQAVLT